MTFQVGDRVVLKGNSRGWWSEPSLIGKEATIIELGGIHQDIVLEVDGYGVQYDTAEGGHVALLSSSVYEPGTIRMPTRRKKHA